MDERTTTSQFTSNAAAKSKPKDELKVELNWAGRVPHRSGTVAERRFGLRLRHHRRIPKSPSEKFRYITRYLQRVAGA